MFFSIAANVAIAIGSSYKGASSKPNDNERTSTPSLLHYQLQLIYQIHMPLLSKIPCTWIHEHVEQCLFLPIKLVNS
jgi:hypothetical protein